VLKRPGWGPDRAARAPPRRPHAWGSVAPPLCTAVHPRYTRYTKRFGAFDSEAAARPSPAHAPSCTPREAGCAHGHRCAHSPRLAMGVKVTLAPPCICLYGESLMKYAGRCESDGNVHGGPRRRRAGGARRRCGRAPPLASAPSRRGRRWRPAPRRRPAAAPARRAGLGADGEVTVVPPCNFLCRITKEIYRVASE
jgi:hypothetical protein